MRKLALVEILIVLSTFTFLLFDNGVGEKEGDTLVTIVGLISIVTIIVGLIVNREFCLVTLLSSPVIPAIVWVRYSDPNDWMIDGGLLMAFILATIYIVFLLTVFFILSPRKTKS